MTKDNRKDLKDELATIAARYPPPGRPTRSEVIRVAAGPLAAGILLALAATAFLAV